MTCIDLSGDIFGDLKVISRNYEYGKERNLKEWNKKTFWNCICIRCGEPTVRQGNSLRSQKDRTTCRRCGNTYIKIGNKYGNLEVLDFYDNKDGQYKSHHKYFVCKCACGNTTVRRAQYLLSHFYPSCGCVKQTEGKKIGARKRMRDLTGEKFGMLTVICLNEDKSKPGQIFWDTRCDCGNQYTVAGKHLKRGATLSCGCLKSSYGEKLIEEILIENSIEYKKEFVVQELNRKRFDFAIFDNGKVSRLIEFDGRQHYVPSHFFGEDQFEKLVKSDKDKNQWAKDNHIPLVRIPYTHINKITYQLLFSDNNFLVG